MFKSSASIEVNNTVEGTAPCHSLTVVDGLAEEVSKAIGQIASDEAPSQHSSSTSTCSTTIVVSTGQKRISGDGRQPSILKSNVRVQGDSSKSQSSTSTGSETTVPSPLTDRRVWSPGQQPRDTATTENKKEKEADEEEEEGIAPVWQPFGGGLDEKPQFRKVQLETLAPSEEQKCEKRAQQSESSKQQTKPRASDASLQSSASPISSPSSPSTATPFTRVAGSSRLPPSQSPTITLLQKAREGQIPKGAVYIDERNHPKGDLIPKDAILIDRKTSVAGDKIHTDSYYAIPTHEITSSNSTVIKAPKYEGIGPTECGIPVGLRTAVKAEYASDWYKTMFRSLHRADSGPDAHLGGYMSEPEFNTPDYYQRQPKSATLDNRRKTDRSTSYNTDTWTIPRSTKSSDSNHYLPSSTRISDEIYRNQPRSIADYEPGHSSIADKEFQKQQQFHPSNRLPAAYEHKWPRHDGYESDSTLIRKTGRAHQHDPQQQKVWYREVQRGGDIPFIGLGKPAPEKPKAESNVDVSNHRPSPPGSIPPCQSHKHIPINHNTKRYTFRARPLGDEKYAPQKDLPMKRGSKSPTSFRRLGACSSPLAPPSPPKRASSRWNPTLIKWSRVQPNDSKEVFKAENETFQLNSVLPKNVLFAASANPFATKEISSKDIKSGEKPEESTFISNVSKKTSKPVPFSFLQNTVIKKNIESDSSVNQLNNQRKRNLGSSAPQEYEEANESRLSYVTFSVNKPKCFKYIPFANSEAKLREKPSPFSDVDTSFCSVETGYHSLGERQTSPSFSEQEDLEVKSLLSLNESTNSIKPNSEILGEKNNASVKPLSQNRTSNASIISTIPPARFNSNENKILAVMHRKENKTKGTTLGLNTENDSRKNHSNITGTDTDEEDRQPIYQQYISAVLKSVSRSQHFLRLKGYYSSMEKLAQIETDNSRDNFSLLKPLYEKLEKGRRKREFFWSVTHRPRWCKEDDRSLRIKHSCVEDLREYFQTLNRKRSSLQSASQSLKISSPLKYRKLWHTVSVSDLIEKYNKLEEVKTKQGIYKKWTYIWHPGTKSSFAEENLSSPMVWKKLQISQWVVKTSESKSNVIKSSEMSVAKNPNDNVCHLRNPIDPFEKMQTPPSIDSQQLDRRKENSLNRFRNEKKTFDKYPSDDIPYDALDIPASERMEISVPATNSERTFNAAEESSAPQSPRTCYSLACSTDSEQQQTTNNLLLVLQPSQRSDDNLGSQLSLDNEAKVSSSSETASTNVSIKTDIFLGHDVHSKVKYFESKLFSAEIYNVRNKKSSEANSLHGNMKSYGQLVKKLSGSVSAPSFIKKEADKLPSPYRSQPLGLTQSSSKLTSNVPILQTRHCLESSLIIGKREYFVSSKSPESAKISVPQRNKSFCDLTSNAKMNRLYPNVSYLDYLMPNYVPERSVSFTDLRTPCQSLLPRLKDQDDFQFDRILSLGPWHSSTLHRSSNRENDHREEFEAIEQSSDIHCFYLMHIRTGGVAKAREKFESLESLPSRASSASRSRSLPRNVKFGDSSNEMNASHSRTTEYGVQWRQKPVFTSIIPWGCVQKLRKRFEKMKNITLTGQFDKFNKSIPPTYLKPSISHYLTDFGSASSFYKPNFTKSPRSESSMDLCPQPSRLSSSIAHSDLYQSSPDLSVESRSENQSPTPNERLRMGVAKSPPAHYSSVSTRIRNLIYRFERQRALQQLITKFEVLQRNRNSSDEAFRETEVAFDPREMLNSSSPDDLHEEWRRRRHPLNESVSNEMIPGYSPRRREPPKKTKSFMEWTPAKVTIPPHQLGSSTNHTDMASVSPIAKYGSGKVRYPTSTPVVTPFTKSYRKDASEKKGSAPYTTASPHQYQETEVNIHYRSPIRNLEKEYIEEEELRKRQEDAMRKFYEEERYKKHLQQLAEMEMRRHSDFFTPSQKSPIPLNRYDNPFDLPSSPLSKTPEPRTLAKALFNFTAQTTRELSFNKGDIIYINKKIDKNWYEGEHHGMIGIFPINYVEIIPTESANLQPRKATEGQAKVKYNFRAQTPVELSLFKGEVVVLMRRVDKNWYEGRIGTKSGIFPSSYVEVTTEPGESVGIRDISPKPPASPVYTSRVVNGTHQKSSPSSNYNTGVSAFFKSPALVDLQQISTEERQPVTQSLHIDTYNEPIPYRALYQYCPQNEDELELHEGDTVYVMEKCDDGWYVGTSLRTGLFGTFPGNYVERI